MKILTLESECLAASARFYVSEWTGLKINDVAILAEDREQGRKNTRRQPCVAEDDT